MVESLALVLDINIIIVTMMLFFVAAIMEIGGGYLVWQWIREKQDTIIGLTGGIILFLYGIIPTLQPSHFGRTYAAYGGIFIVASIVWGVIVDKKKPNRFEIIGSLVAISGAIIIFYTPCFCSVVHPTASLSELP
jgi:small multidrug resistance family-3 protein